MPSRLSVLLVVCGYLLTASLGLLTWLSLRTGAPPLQWGLALCLAPVALYLVLAWRTRDLAQFVARSAACFGLLPVLLLLGGASNAFDFTPAPQRVEPQLQTAPSIDLFRLFTGARSVRDLPMGHGGIEIMRRAVFPDNSELTFYRFNNVTQAEAHLAFLQRAQRGRPVTLGSREGVRLAPDGERYVYIEKHDRELVQVEAPNEAAVLARLQAQNVAPPVPTAAGASAAQTAAAAAPMWPFTFSYALVHAVALVGFWVWTHRHRRTAAAAGV